jgi:HAD superfamily hydrolase (TIGR01509 family)
MLELVIFDNDGTLVDSEPLGHRAMAQVLAERGLRVDAEDLCREFRGWELARALDVLARRNRVTLGNDVVQSYRARLQDLLRRELRAMPGAHEAVSAAAEAGLHRAVASGGPLTKIRTALEVTGLIRAFGERLFSSYEVGSFKPDPGLFLHVARHFGCAPARCLVVEDSAVGVEAARRAGMEAVLVGDAEVDGPVRRITSLHGLAERFEHID